MALTDEQIERYSRQRSYSAWQLAFPPGKDNPVLNAFIVVNHTDVSKDPLEII